MSGIDLEKLGAIAPESEASQPERVDDSQPEAEEDPIRILFDSIMVSFQQRDQQIAELQARLTQLEGFVSYLLTKDPKVKANLEKAVQENGAPKA